MAHFDPALAHEAPLRAAELGDAAALVAEAGWNQVAADWRIFLDLGTVYAVRNSASRVIATAATLSYGGRFGWISMVLVAGSYRRQGLARRLMNRCIADLTAAAIVPVLDATPAGRSIYLALGFQDAWGFHRLAGKGMGGNVSLLRPPPGILIQPIGDRIYDELCRYDAAAFGADRSGVLARLRGRVPAADLVALRDDGICGFLLGRDGQSATQFGPLVAENAAIAQALLARGFAAVDGPVYIDLADAKVPVRAWLSELGFAAQRPLTRMLHRRSTSFEDAARTFAVAGPELG
ncbi:MAG: GNAT family N-acetyltransferase [Xanthobacteraceae bacterium]